MSEVPEAKPLEFWEAPDKRFTKAVVSKGFGFYTPQDGSVCKVKVIRDESKVLPDVNDEQIKELIISDVDFPIDRVLEACIRTMKMEETCILRFPDPSQPFPAVIKSSADKDGKSPTTTPQDEQKIQQENTESNKDHDAKSENDSDGNSGVVHDVTHDNYAPMDTTDVSEASNMEIQPDDAQDSSKADELTSVDGSQMDMEKSYTFDPSPTIFEVEMQLLSYTREPEIWEMSITEKWRRANYHKQKGMELYSRGQFEWAFRRFSLALKYLISLEHDVPSGQEEGMNISGLKLSCYLNVAACQMRHHNYESVVKNCTKALDIQKNNSKALYRRGAAFIQLQEYEKAKGDLDRAQELEPKNQAIVSQQQLLKAKVQKLNQYYANAMKKLFM